MDEGPHRRPPAALRGDRHAREGEPAPGRQGHETKADINSVRDAKKGEKDIKPGLNLVGKLTGKGETGFIDGQGVSPQGPDSRSASTARCRPWR